MVCWWKITEFKFSESDISVSFDVCSLYTNVPLDETIDLITDFVYSEESVKVPPFPKKWFKKLLKFATSGIFMYKDKLYRQVDGVAMGSPLGPSLANFFLGHLERYKFFSNASLNPKLYIRYVDDIFAVFDKNTPFQPFLDHLNSQHKNIKFTVEESINHVLPFLNTEMKLVGDHFESCVFRKSTNTNVVLNMSAVCPMSWKKSLIFGALNRAKIICSNRDLFLEEVENLRVIFWKNGYSNSFFNNIYDIFIHKQASNREVSKDETEERRFFIRIPYVGTISHDFKQKLTKLFYNDLNVNISPVFNTFKVSNFFPLKSKTPMLLTSHVVYKFTGLCDTNLTYIGKSKRHLVTRCIEHLSTSHKSEIQEHIKVCPICRDSKPEHFEILKKCRTDQECKIYEALFIKTFVPPLNKNLFNSGSFYTLKVYQ